jgi:hypothetical protein
METFGGVEYLLASDEKEPETTEEDIKCLAFFDFYNSLENKQFFGENESEGSSESSDGESSSNKRKRRENSEDEMLVKQFFGLSSDDSLGRFSGEEKNLESSSEEEDLYE